MRSFDGVRSMGGGARTRIFAGGKILRGTQSVCTKGRWSSGKRLPPACLSPSVPFVDGGRWNGCAKVRDRFAESGGR
jgi:hypothetical protein